MFSGRTGLLLALALLPLAACGEDEPEPEGPYAEAPVGQIADDAGRANAGVEAVRVKGSFVLDGKKMHVSLAIAGADCRGTLRTRGEGQIRLVHVDGTSYFKADEEFWRTQAGDDQEAARLVQERIGDRWTFDSSDPSGFAQMCDVDTFLGAIDTDAFATIGAKVTGTAPVAGLSTVAISYPLPKGGRGQAYVAEEAPHYLVKVVEKGSTELVFRDFDAPIVIKTPPGGETFDLDSL